MFFLQLFVIATAPLTYLKLVSREGTVSQTITGNQQNPVLFGTEIVNELPSVLEVTTNGGGNLFTCKIKPLRLMISWSIRFHAFSGTTVPGNVHTSLVLSTSPFLFGQISRKAVNQPGMSSSCVIDMMVNSSFKINAFVTSGTVQLSFNGLYLLSTLQILSLN